MSNFMNPEIEYGQWIRIDGYLFTEFIPSDLCNIENLRENENWTEKNPNQFYPKNDNYIDLPKSFSDYCENQKACEIEIITGYGCRLTAPGYLDCTEWTVYDSWQNALDELILMYDLTAEEEENLKEDCIRVFGK